MLGVVALMVTGMLASAAVASVRVAVAGEMLQSMSTESAAVMSSGRTVLTDSSVGGHLPRAERCSPRRVVMCAHPGGC